MSYESVPYSSHPFVQTHPRRLRTHAWLRGMVASELNRCRVLELGCGAGGNLTPMAHDFPDSRFVGIDNSPRAIADARAYASQLKLTNVEFREEDICEAAKAISGATSTGASTTIANSTGAATGAAPKDEQFDYVIAHGVYSWVPLDVRNALLDTIKRRLAPGGVAYVSYNTLPGWSVRGMFGELLRFHAAGAAADAPAQVAAARQLLSWLPESLPGNANPYSTALQGEVRRLSKLDDGYLCHEFLETVNHPVLLRDFLGELSGRGLRYLGEAEYRTMTAADVPAAARQQIARLTADPLRREQYYDFCRWQTFRSTLICHTDEPLDATINFERVAALSFASDVEPADAGPLDLAGPTLHAFARGGWRVNTAHPWFKAALLHLGRKWPAWSSFGELVAVAARALGVELPPRAAWPTIRQLVELAEALHQAYANGVVDAALDAPALAREPVEPLVGYPPARLRAESIPLVPTATHCVATLQGFQRHVLRMLDGRSRSDIVSQLAADARDSLILTDAHGRPITSGDELHQIIARTLDETLAFLAKQGLLVPPTSKVQP